MTYNWEYTWDIGRGGAPSHQEEIRRTDQAQWHPFPVPGKPRYNAGKHTVWLRVKLPDGNWKKPCFLFRTSQQAVKVYYEGNLLYQYGSMEGTDKRTTQGSMWNFVSIPSDFEGKDLVLQVYSPFNEYVGYVGEVYFGSKSDLILKIFRDHMDSVVLGDIFIFIGVSLGLVYFFGKRKEIALLGIALSSASLGAWVIAESKITQFMLNSPIAWLYIAFAAIYLMPIGFCIFFERIFNGRNKIFFRRLWQIYICFALFSFTMELTGMMSLFTSVRFFHMLLIITMVGAIYAIFRSFQKGAAEVRAFTAGFIVLCAAGIYDIIGLFYTIIPLPRAQRFTPWGMLVFIMVCIYILGKRSVDFYNMIEIDSWKNRTNYRQLFKNMIDGLIYCKIITDEDGAPIDCSIVEVNDAFMEYMIKESREIVGRNISEIMDCPGNGDWISTLLKNSSTKDSVEFPDPIFHRDRWFSVSAFSPIEGYCCLIFKDITSNKEAEDVIRYQVYHDSVTGLYSRTYFEEQMKALNDELALSKDVSIISIDLDGLKIANDTFGHSTGDQLLRETANIIKSTLKNNEFVARIGGDEFCIILPNPSMHTAGEIEDKITEKVEEYNRNNPLIPIGLSMGTAVYDSTCDDDIYSIFKRADDSMYQHKFSQAKSAKSNVIHMLLTALSERDHVSEGHVERLVNMVEYMKECLVLSNIETRNLTLLAKMHDLGKIGIPDEILFKPDKLTHAEYGRMKEHVRIGYSIASRTNELSGIAPLILHHHECWDGSGYPDGLKGEEIPLECRIFSIIDAYDVMTNIRPYSSGFNKDDAVKELARCSGTQFDPFFAERFIQIILQNDSGF